MNGVMSFGVFPRSSGPLARKLNPPPRLMPSIVLRAPEPPPEPSEVDKLQARVDALQAQLDRINAGVIEEGPFPWRCAQLRDIAANAFGVSPADILSDRRTRNIIRPRQVAMFLCKHFTSRSYPEIGKHIGRRDHTTVLHGCRTVQQVLDALLITPGNDPIGLASQLAAITPEEWDDARRGIVPVKEEA